jgi:HrpA-like RNA helicase
VFITQGLLLRQVRSDPLLLKYDALVVDEVHERHLPADVLLGVLKVVLDKRNGPRSGLKPLKVVLMSATLNAELFSQYFQLAPVLTVPGRMYHVPRRRRARRRGDAPRASGAAAAARGGRRGSFEWCQRWGGADKRSGGGGAGAAAHQSRV